MEFAWFAAKDVTWNSFWHTLLDRDVVIEHHFCYVLLVVSCRNSDFKSGPFCDAARLIVEVGSAEGDFLGGVG